MFLQGSVSSTTLTGELLSDFYNYGLLTAHKRVTRKKYR